MMFRRKVRYRSNLEVSTLTRSVPQNMACIAGLMINTEALVAEHPIIDVPMSDGGDVGGMT